MTFKTLKIGLVSGVMFVSLQAHSQSKWDHSTYPVKRLSQVKKMWKAVRSQKKLKRKSEQKKAWTVAVYAPIYDRPDLGLRALALLKTAQAKLRLSPGSLAIVEGRTLYQMGQLKDAIRAYRGVPESSTHWLEAQEEMAWAYLRLERPEQTLAITKTVLSPVFSKQVGPEPYVLNNLAHLALCDYESVFKSAKTFKKNFLPRLGSLEKIKKNSARSTTPLVTGSFKSEAPFKGMAGLLEKLPRGSHRDLALNSGVLKNKESRVQFRLTVLARKELTEIKDMTQRLHLIEAEVIQRLHLEDRAKKRDQVVSSEAPHKGEILNFPDSKEVWLDELGSYAVKAKACPKLKEARL